MCGVQGSFTLEGEERRGWREAGRAQRRMMGQDKGRMTDVLRGTKEEVAETQAASHSSGLDCR